MGNVVSIEEPCYENLVFGLKKDLEEALEALKDVSNNIKARQTFNKLINKYPDIKENILSPAFSSEDFVEEKRRVYYI